MTVVAVARIVFTLRSASRPPAAAAAWSRTFRTCSQSSREKLFSVDTGGATEAAGPGGRRKSAVVTSKSARATTSPLRDPDALQRVDDDRRIAHEHDRRTVGPEMGAHDALNAGGRRRLHPIAKRAELGERHAVEKRGQHPGGDAVRRFDAQRETACERGFRRVEFARPDRLPLQAEELVDQSRAAPRRSIPGVS